MVLPMWLPENPAALKVSLEQYRVGGAAQFVADRRNGEYLSSLPNCPVISQLILFRPTPGGQEGTKMWQEEMAGSEEKRVFIVIFCIYIKLFLSFCM